MGFPKTKPVLEEAMDAHRRVLAETTDAVDARTQRKRGYALWEAGEVLLRLERLERKERSDWLEEAVSNFDGAATTLWPFSAERHTAVYARWRQATTLTGLNRQLEALTVLSDLIKEIGVDWDDPDHPDVMPIVLGMWVGQQRLVGHLDAADASADTVIKRVGDGTTPNDRMLLGMSYLAKSSASEARGQHSAALGFLDRATSCCSSVEDAPHPYSLLSVVAEALVSRGIILEMLGRPDDALAAYDEVIDRFVGNVRDNGNIAWAFKTAHSSKKRLRKRHRLFGRRES